MEKLSGTRGCITFPKCAGFADVNFTGKELYRRDVIRMAIISETITSLTGNHSIKCLNANQQYKMTSKKYASVYSSSGPRGSHRWVPGSHARTDSKYETVSICEKCKCERHFVNSRLGGYGTVFYIMNGVRMNTLPKCSSNFEIDWLDTR